MYRNIKKHAAILTAALAAASAGAVSGGISYQGMVTAPNGQVLNNSSAIMGFTIYDAAISGSPLWAEGHAGVVVSNGLFCVILGEAIPLPPVGDIRASDLWLEVEYEGEVMSPRMPMVSVISALSADDADTLDGLDSSDFTSEPVFSAHASDPDAHHVKTTSFSELGDQASDAQIPDSITINHASNSDTLDGHDSSYFARAAGTVSIPASALLPRDNGITYDSNGARMAVPDIGDRVFIAPVFVPDGARLTNVVLEAYDNSSGEFGGHVKMELVRFSYNNAWPMATLDTGISVAPGNIRMPQALNHTVDNSEYSYGISVTINNGTGGAWSMLFYKAIITYTGD